MHRPPAASTPDPRLPDRGPGGKSPAPRAQGPRSPHASKWAVLALVAVGTFMTTLDGSIVNIGLPAIARSLNVALGGPIEWIIIGYLVTIASVLLTFGRLSDMIGRKPIWAAGLATFTLGSAACGAAPSLPLLIAARAFQGLGAALLFAPSVALLTDAFPSRERGRAIGLNAVVVALGISTGPTLGGFITEYFSWRWIFYVNVPLGALGLAATWKILGQSRRQAQRFDPFGAILLAVGLASITLGLSFGQEWGWTSPRLFGAATLGVAALVAAVLVEQRVRDPILDLSLLRNRQFASAMLSLVLSFLALFAVSFLLPFYLENLRGFPTVQSGLLLTPLSLTVAVVAPLSGSLADRVGSRWLAAGGLACACVGLFFLAQVGADTAVPDLVWRLVIIGLGVGTFQSPNNRALMSAAPGSEQGEASGLLGTGRVVGQSLSVAIAGAVFASLGGAAASRALVEQGQRLSPDQVSALQQTFVGAFHAALLVCAGLAACGILTALERGNDAARPAAAACRPAPPAAEERS